MGASRAGEESVEKRGREIYEGLRKKLERYHSGKTIAIEVDSCRYYIGRDALEAHELARIRHPQKALFYRRIRKDSAPSMRLKIRI